MVAGLLFLGWTAGIDAWDRREADRREVTAADLSIPSAVYDPPLVLDDTTHNGPTGPVALVFQGVRYRHGLVGAVDDPWIMVSAVTGDYRALNAPHLPERGDGEVTVSPDGTMLAWGWPGGVVVYDTHSGRVRQRPTELDEQPHDLVWSPDGSRLAFYADGVHVLDAITGELTAVPQLSQRPAQELSFGPEGDFLVVAAPDRLTTVQWDSGERRVVPADLGRVVDIRPAGETERLALLSDERFRRTIRLADLAPRGRVQVDRLVAEGMAVQDLIGWVGDGAVAVVALQLETGSLRAIYSISLTDGTSVELVALPGEGGTNWIDNSTLSVASALLDNVAPADEPQWPWDPRAKLSAVSIGVVLVLGSLLLRPPKTGRR